jgi:integrase
VRGRLTVQAAFAKEAPAHAPERLRPGSVRAKLTDVTPLALRHTFASRLAMAGVPLRAIQELGGWRSLHIVERYAHLSPEHQADAIERLVDFTTGFTTRASGRLKRAAQVR